VSFTAGVCSGEGVVTLKSLPVGWVNLLFGNQQPGLLKPDNHTEFRCTEALLQLS